MLRRACTVALTLTLFLPAVALADAGKTITATGTGRVPVKPTNRNDDASIRAAVAAARKQAIPAALADARDQAGTFATAAGLTLGGVQSVADAGPNGPPPFDFPQGPPPFPVAFGPLGIQNFCGIAHIPVFGGKGRHRKPVRFIVHRACFVPPFAGATLTVTFAAT